MSEAKKDDTKKKSTKKSVSEKEFLALQEQNAALNDKLLRLAAEMANVKRHAEEDLQKVLKYEGEELIIKLLPIVDNFERAIALEDKNLGEAESKFLDGFKMIYANLIGLLKSLGVEEIEAQNQPFDPTKMEAVLTESIIEEENGIVLDVLQKGYIYKDKVIRPAMVKVNE